VPALAVVAVTVIAGRHLAIVEWLRPELWFAASKAGGTVFFGRELAFEGFVLNLADTLRSLGPSIDVVEAWVAAAVMTVLCGLLAVIAHVLPVSITRAWPGLGADSSRERRVELFVRVLWVVGSIAVASSVQTRGGALLLPGALGMLALLSSSQLVRGARLSWRGLLGPILWTSLVLLALAETWAAVSEPGRFLSITALLGGLVAVAAMVATAVSIAMSRRKVHGRGR
jgi:hypothetical protein